jgi:hypothetical protein
LYNPPVFSKQEATPSLAHSPLGQIKQGYYLDFIAVELQRASGAQSETQRRPEIMADLEGFGKVEERVRVK